MILTNFLGKIDLKRLTTETNPILKLLFYLKLDNDRFSTAKATFNSECFDLAEREFYLAKSIDQYWKFSSSDAWFGNFIISLILDFNDESKDNIEYMRFEQFKLLYEKLIFCLKHIIQINAAIEHYISRYTSEGFERIILYTDKGNPITPEVQIENFNFLKSLINAAHGAIEDPQFTDISYLFTQETEICFDNGTEN